MIEYLHAHIQKLALIPISSYWTDVRMDKPSQMWEDEPYCPG